MKKRNATPIERFLFHRHGAYSKRKWELDAEITNIKRKILFIQNFMPYRWIMNALDSNIDKIKHLAY